MSNVNRVLFMGSKQLGLRVLREMYSLSPETLIGALTIDDTNDTRTALSGFQSFSNESNLELHTAKNRKQSEQIIEDLKPDLCLVVGWYWLISNRVIDAVPRGFIGIHNSLLPYFRGGSPLIWQIISNEKEVGFSFFSFTQSMDDGPIWAQGSVLVEEHDYISHVLRKLEDKTVEVLREKYPLILNGDIRPVEQQHELATYCAQRFPNDGNIDWHKPAHDTYNFIRAQSDPYPGAFTYFEAQMLKIWKAKMFEGKYYGTPGQVARITADGVYVICGDNSAIILEDVELGGKRGKANDFIKCIRGRMSKIIGESSTDAKP
jgi:methionyl-tRNA formyltransferase